MSVGSELTNEKPFEGVLEELSLGKGAKKEYVRLKISGLSYLFFDIEYYKKNIDQFKIGSNCQGAFIESEYTNKEGNLTTSRIVQGIGFAEATPPTQQTIPAKESFGLKDTELLESCFEDSIQLLEKFKLQWTTEDIRAVAISLFIKRSRG